MKNTPACSTSSMLETLHATLAVWKGACAPVRTQSGIGTGFPEVDEALLDGGWPQAALMELLTDQTGMGEFSLLLPVLARLTTSQGVLLIAPPFVPYAPALAQAGIDLRRLLILPPCAAREGLASAELALRSGACGAVLIWESELSGLSAQGIPYLALKRLHLAAERGKAMAVVYRAQCHALQPSPAAVRIRLTQAEHRLQMRVFKRRGLFGEQKVSVTPWPLPVQQHIAHRPTAPAWYAIPSTRLARPHAAAY